MSVMHGECNARPTVTFPATRHHCPLAGTELYCFVTGAGTYVLTTCPGLHSTAGWLGFDSATYWLEVRHPAATPPSHTDLFDCGDNKMQFCLQEFHWAAAWSH